MGVASDKLIDRIIVHVTITIVAVLNIKKRSIMEPVSIGINNNPLLSPKYLTIPLVPIITNKKEIKDVVAVLLNKKEENADISWVSE